MIARYIRHHKKNVKEALVCPLKANCDTVIHSDYSKFLGIPLEVLGMIYYGLSALSYGLLMIFPSIGTTFVVSSLMLASVCAFIFSTYLTIIQAFILKNWCTWCIISATICAAIFLIDILNSPLL
ncbi:MAG: hypothetical protein HYT62_03765 [Candidatus Yanofskybacteria bacterium]|nr:hypothetical protein [Candidatus Yanofskybacteria bacterium]